MTCVLAISNILWPSSFYLAFHTCTLLLSAYMAIQILAKIIQFVKYLRHNSQTASFLHFSQYVEHRSRWERMLTAYQMKSAVHYSGGRPSHRLLCAGRCQVNVIIGWQSLTGWEPAVNLSDVCFSPVTCVIWPWSLTIIYNMEHKDGIIVA